MVVPARPTAGAPIDSGWGGIAHDTAVAQDTQTGSVSISVSASTQGSAVVTFPRPFAGTPTIVAMVGPSSSGAALSYSCQAAAVSATGATLRLAGGGSTTFTVPVMWIAIGPRA
jgi:hypothetical protein